MATTQASQMPPGPGVDAQGRSVVDPSENVRALTDAAVARLDDIGELRAAHHERLEQLRTHYEGLLRDSEKELRKAESDRIDAIRAVDVGNVQQAAAVQAQLAETLRLQVATTAAAFDVKLSTALDPLLTAIADLRRVQYESVGQRTQVVDSRGEVSDMKPILDAIAALTAAQAENRGQQIQRVESRQSFASVYAAIGAVAVILGLLQFALQSAGK